MTDSKDFVVLVGQYNKDPRKMTFQEKAVNSTQVSRVVVFSIPEDMTSKVPVARVWVRKSLPIWEFIIAVVPYNVYMDQYALSDPVEAPEWYKPPEPPKPPKPEVDEEGKKHYKMEAESHTFEASGPEKSNKKRDTGVEKGNLSLLS